jgi:hypothetical protein
MEGNIVDIPLKGIARAGSNQSCEDGLCNEIIGLEWKDGSYVPVGFDKNLSYSVNGYAQKVWVHKTTNTENTLVLRKVKDKEEYLIYWLEKTSEIGFDDAILVRGLTAPVEKIGIVNNTIRICDKVFLFYDNKYNELNISDKSFSMQLDVRRNGVALLHDWCDEKVQKEFTDGTDTWEGSWIKQNLQKLESNVKGAEYLTGMAFMRYALKLYDGTYINASMPILVCDTLQDNLNNFTPQANHTPNSIRFNKDFGGYSSNVRFIGYLINMGWKFNETDKLNGFYTDDDSNGFRGGRLYELNTMKSGDTFFKEECPFNTPKSIKTAQWDNSKDYDVEFNNIDFGTYELSDYSVASGMKTNGLSSYILSPDVNSYDWRLPNDSGEGSGNNFTNPTGNVWINGDNNENWFNAWSGNEYKSAFDFDIPSEYCYRGRSLGQYFDNGEQKTATKKIHQLFASRNLATPVFRIKNNLTDSDKNLIVSVDVFMTRPVSLFENEMNYTSSYEGNQRKFKTKDQIKKELNDSLVAFYKILEMPFDKVKALDVDKIYIPYIERGRISQIEQQEILPQGYPHIDYFGVNYTYNNRLHIADLQTKLFDNYSDLFSPICNRYENTLLIGSQKNIVEVIAEIKIKDVDKVNTITTTIECNNYTNTGLYGQNRVVLPANIIYPDERATEIKILGVKINDIQYYSFGKQNTFELKKANGFATYVNLTNIEFVYYEDTISTIPTNDNLMKRNGNIFKVSSANNLIDFPLLQTYQVSNGDIVGFASSTKALSQGQFGQYPLYVFTTEGIWVMNTNGQGTYSNAEPLSREVCCNTNGILELDGAVLFTTKKGLMLLSGSEVVPFAPQLVGEVGLTPAEEEQTNCYVGEEVYRKVVTNSQLVELSESVSYDDFKNFVSDSNTRLSYIYDKNKVLVYNNQRDYCYLIDIQAKIATKIAERIHFDDGNYPEPKFGIAGTVKTADGVTYDGFNLKSMAYKLEPNEYTQTMFQTRPIKLGTYDLKSSFRVVLRGKFDVEIDKFDAKNNKKAGLYVLGSNDTERWMYLGGTERGGSFYDLGTTIHRVSCKYFMVIYVGSISGDSKINGLEISSNVKYNNKLK